LTFSRALESQCVVEPGQHKQGVAELTRDLAFASLSVGEGKKIAAGVWISVNILGQEMLYTDSFMKSDFI
jgi:hypothetical protein